jgi:hypothetical protein
LLFLLQNFTGAEAKHSTAINALYFDVEREYAPEGGFGYDPQRLLLTHPFFASNVMRTDLSVAQQAALFAEGHVIVPYMPFLSNEMQPIQ